MESPEITISKDYRVIQGIVTGALHVKNDLPCQDWIYFIDHKLITLSVADGHGSKRHFRSDRGAKYAVDAAIDTFIELDNKGMLNETSINNLKTYLPKMIVNKWRHDVMKHIEEKAPDKDEAYNRLSEHEKAAISKRNLDIYGTTLITIAITQKRIFFLQLGDGDILCVYDDRIVTRPFVRHQEISGNETDSLCMNNAEVFFQVKVLDKDKERFPVMIMASTDGLSNSYKTNEDFEKAAIDILTILQREGHEFVKQSLKGWLEGISAKGSGDDIALGIIYSTILLKKQGG